MSDRKSSFSGVMGKIGKADDSIRNEPVEYAVLLDEQGNEIGRSTSDNLGYVTIPPELTYKMREAILTHNHPRGTTFSPEDVANAIMNGLKEIRATTATNGTYVLRRKFSWLDGEHSDDKYIYWWKEYSNAFNAIRKDVQARIFSGEIKNMEEASREDNRRREEWLRNHAPDYGWEYKKER